MTERTLTAALVGAKLVLHLAMFWRYGYHRDELYFIACGQKLALGYVDHPPFVPWLARGIGILFDHSLFGMRLLPALAGAAIVWLTILVARRLGGGLYAQAIAGTCIHLPCEVTKNTSVLSLK